MLPRVVEWMQKIRMAVKRKEADVEWVEVVGVDSAVVRELRRQQAALAGVRVMHLCGITFQPQVEGCRGWAETSVVVKTQDVHAYTISVRLCRAVGHMQV